MSLVRRRFLRLASATGILPAVARVASAQAPQGGGPKLTQILRADLRGQDEKVQESVVNTLEMAPGVTAPWHMHPGAQELLFVYGGALTIEVEGQGTRVITAGEVGLIPAEIPHLAKNESATVLAKAVVTHSRADKTKPLTVVVKRST
jgi:quercetin dioxygenase-like cupin family protein